MVFCQYLNEKGELKKYKNDFEYNVNSGMMFMVIDLGGMGRLVVNQDLCTGLLLLFVYNYSCYTICRLSLGIHNTYFRNLH